MTASGRRTIGIMGVGGLVLLVLALTAAPAAARKPDLVVKSATMSDPDGAYVFYNSNPQVAFKGRTANVGHAVAPRSTTAFLLSPHRASPLTHEIVAGYADVPRLRPGASDVGRYHARLEDSSSIPPYGRYYVFACADYVDHVTEGDETNNCRYTGRTLDVIARRFVGLVRGYAPLGYGPNVKESWSGNLTFSFQPGLSNNGFYRYGPSGSLTYTVSGSDGTCTYKGTKNHDVGGTGSLTLNYSTGTYQGGGTNFAPFFYYVQDCGKFGKTMHYEGTEAAWWDTGGPYIHFDLRPFKLVYSYACCDATWIWNLLAES